MSKILCEFEGKKIVCKVVDNLGYQDGYYAKCVEYNGKNRIVVKRGGIWSPRTIEEKMGITFICGQ